MPFLQLMLISLLWGSSFIFIKTASLSFDAAGIAAARAGIAAGTLVLLALLRRAPWPVAARDWGKLAALAAIGQVFPFLMLGLASHLAASIDMALMMGAAPLITFVLGRYIPPAETWSGRAALGLALGFVGVATTLIGPGGEAGATYARLNNFLVPPLGLICGGVWLHEPVGSAALIGPGLILSGVGLVRRPAIQS